MPNHVGLSPMLHATPSMNGRSQLLVWGAAMNTTRAYGGGWPSVFQPKNFRNARPTNRRNPSMVGHSTLAPWTDSAGVDTEMVYGLCP